MSRLITLLEFEKVPYSLKTGFLCNNPQGAGDLNIPCAKVLEKTDIVISCRNCPLDNKEKLVHFWRMVDEQIK